MAKRSEMIAANVATKQKMRILAFHPSGLFSLTDSKWVKIYRVSAASLPEIIKGRVLLGNRFRITKFKRAEEDSADIFVSVEIQATNKEDAEEVFAKLEEQKQLKALSVEEYVKCRFAMTGNEYHFDLATYLREKKSFDDICLEGATFERERAEISNAYVKQLYFLRIPTDIKTTICQVLDKAGCDYILTYNFCYLDEEDLVSVKRVVEASYNVSISDTDKEYVCLSFGLCIFSDMEESLRLLCDLVSKQLTDEGFIVTSCMGNRREDYEDITGLYQRNKLNLSVLPVDVLHGHL